MNILSNIQNSIPRRLILYIVLFSSLITLLITIFQLYLEYVGGVSRVNAQIHQIETLSVPSLIENVWDIYEKQIQRQLEDLVKLSDLRYLEIRSKGKVVASAGNPVSKNIISKMIPLIYTQRGEQILIGKLLVVATLEGVYQGLINKLFTILVSNGVKTSLVSLFMFFIFHFVVIKRLSKISNHLKQFTPERFDTILKSKGTTYQDELHQVVTIINEMGANLFKTTVSRNYFDNIIKSMMDMLIVLNPDGTIKYINQAVKEELRYEENEIINQQFSYLIEEKEKKPIIDLLTEKGFVEQTEKILIAKDGKKIPVLVSGSVMRGNNNNIQGIVYTARNISEIKQLIKKKQELAAMAVMAAEKEKSKSKKLKEAFSKLKETQIQLIQSAKLASLGEMSSGLAHEINNPLFLIKGFNNRIKVKLSKDNKDAYEQVHDYVQEVNENSLRIMKIVKHFREFSRQAEHNFMPISINDVVSRSFILLYEKLKLCSISIKQNLTMEDPKIMGDGIQLEQVFINIINNARDAIEEAHGTKGGDLVVCTRREGKKSTIVEFSDNGNGVNEEQLEKIFDPFYTTKEVGKGTGLGLSISYGIIKEHKGEIDCIPNADKGTTFRIKLPVLSSA